MCNIIEDFAQKTFTQFKYLNGTTKSMHVVCRSEKYDL